MKIEDVEYVARKQKNGREGSQSWQVEQHARLGDCAMTKVLIGSIPRIIALRVAKLLTEAYELGTDPLYEQKKKEQTDEAER